MRLVIIMLAGVMAVAACQQPTPGVTMQSGSRVVRSSATLYVRGGNQVRGSGAVKVLTVRPGALVGIDVDRSLAERGWTVHIQTRTSDATPLNSSVLKGQHHFSFDVGSSPTDVVISEVGVGAAPGGLWAFTLQPTLL